VNDHLKEAKAAIAEAERQAMLNGGNLAPAMHYGRATAHALVGILEHLTEAEDG
jgi:hypothetical protein